MPSRILDVLRWILLCGEDERERSHHNHPSRNAGASVSSDWNRAGYRTLPSSPPSRSLGNSLCCGGNYTGYPSTLPPAKPAQSSLIQSRASPSTSASSKPAQSPLPPSKPAQSSLIQSRASLIQSRASPSTSASSKPAQSLLPPSKPAPSTPASSKPAQSSPIQSKASPSSSASSKPAQSSPIQLKASPSSSASAKPAQSPLPPTSNPSPSSSASSNPSTSPLLSSNTPQPSAPRSPSYSSRTERGLSWQVVQSPRNPSSNVHQSSPPQSPSYPISSPETTLGPSSSTSQPEKGRARQDVRRYEIPKHLEEQFKNGIVPEVLRRPLSPSTYADYFATLLHAEDFYFEKWSDFLLSGVTLQLQERELYETRSRGNKKANEIILVEKKPFVSFEIDAIPERRPYLLSRDFVFLKGSLKATKPFKGIIFRVVKSRMVLVDFGDDFHSQHSSSNRYDVSFSFNRVCLKRAHQAIAAMDSSLHDVLFPKANPFASSLISQTNQSHCSIASRIVHHNGHLPYLIEGPGSATGTAIQQAILKIYKKSPSCRILVCAPTNRSCDAVTRSMHDEIPRVELFRANAAFRDYDLVPEDIIPESLYEGDCFTCPSLYELQSYKVITSTYVSSFRLQAAGVGANHFTHIFLVDAPSTMEPDVVIPLTSFVGKDTVVVVTGSSGDSPKWVRSDIARRHGLKRSYFDRILHREPYVSRKPECITQLGDAVKVGSRLSMLSQLQRSEHYMTVL